MMGNYERRKMISRRQFLRRWLAATALASPGLRLLGRASDQPPVTFRESTPSESGIKWVHTNAHSEQRYLPETFAPGVAIFDYNNDGLMDILFVNTGETSFFHPATPLRSALSRNNGDGTFTDVTTAAGLTANLFGMGAAVGDYDGDGHQDVFLTGCDKSILYHNNGNGTFTDVTAQTGIVAPGWSTSAVWFDYNNDGLLDLFVCQYLDYSSLRSCGIENAYGSMHEGIPKNEGPHQNGILNTYYCNPRLFPPLASHLYRNDGGGHFTDVSKETGILNSLGKGLGVVATDVNNDGFMDLFVSNDTMANFLFMNRGGKSFEEAGLASGVGYSEDGLARSGMGVDAVDLDGDGWEDLFLTDLDQEIFSIYHNNGDETFDDISQPTGIAAATNLLSGWGARFLDYDNDGLPDLIVVNGHPDDRVGERSRSLTYQESLLLLHNAGNGRMLNVSGRSGEIFQRKFSARGLAVGDLNNDGYLDVVVGVNGGPPLILYNNAESRNNWVGLNLMGTKANPAAAGAIISWSARGVVRSRLKTAGGSYLSSHDNREVLGLGKAAEVDWIEIRWPRPSTRVDRFTEIPLGKYLTIVEGKGRSD
jgi:hypothetical protein